MAQRLGLMTSLPLYWPLDASFSEIANGDAPVPWQRAALERHYDLELLDTLSPIAGLSAEAPETDPLAGIEHLAIIQPRGLSPADNVALDSWVRSGGKVLLVLDPLLTGEYDVPLGDPRRPTDSALVAPVVRRWGLDIRFSFEDLAEEGQRSLIHRDGVMFALQAGEILLESADDASCQLDAETVIARCEVGEGHVTLIADAAMFEHLELAGERGEGLAALVQSAFP